MKSFFFSLILLFSTPLFTQMIEIANNEEIAKIEENLKTFVLSHKDYGNQINHADLQSLLLDAIKNNINIDKEYEIEALDSSSFNHLPEDSKYRSCTHLARTILNTILLMPCADEKEESKSIEMLLENGANPNQESCLGYTPLMQASWSKKPAAIGTLVHYGARNIGTKNCGNESAYDFADESASVREMLQSAFPIETEQPLSSSNNLE